MKVKSKSVIFYGDSICAGQNFPVHRGWVYRISENLKDILVSNVSINGRTTRQALETMPNEIQANPPSVLVIQFGMNDCNYWKTDMGVPRVSKEAFLANLKEITNRALNAGVETVIVNTNHPTGLDKIMPDTEISYQHSNEEYNILIRRACDEMNILTIDMEQEFLKEIERTGQSRLDFLLEDLLHLNQNGHDLYFNTICPIVKAFLK
jgi:lysophospholipase L1-like esterase